MKWLDRTGEIGFNKDGIEMKICEYINNAHIVVLFPSGYKKETNYSNFKNGSVKDMFAKSVYGVGIIGLTPTYENGIIKGEYKSWREMLRRCYSDEFKNSNKTYKNVTCCKEWLSYENYYNWLHSQDNWENISKGYWALDKDIIQKGNKEYSPEKCCLVPINVNSLFTKADKVRGKYPIGVIYHKDHHCFESQCSDGTKHQIHRTNFNTPEEAFKQYKKDKEAVIKDIAKKEYLKGNITKGCYEAMIKYEVEITD